MTRLIDDLLTMLEDEVARRFQFEYERWRAESAGTPSRWRHRKRLTEYGVLVATAEAQCSTGPIKEGDRVTVYVDDNGGWWVRKTDEFQDGRFERVSV